MKEKKEVKKEMAIGRGKFIKYGPTHCEYIETLFSQEDDEDEDKTEV